ncbi:MAG TPA: exo-beta-N-acetylmuramidase NamZ domain-containing protein, partial [Abditibacteriaceae bacterium]|nr:exo-beta-N-acetylmuramidase NamZ domain-containing protein [Abditibacteriaceae bacterium]
MPRTLPGLDVLDAAGAPAAWKFLRGRRIGLLTNHTGSTLDGTPALAALCALDLEVTALFSPEHGPAGTREGPVESGRSEDGLPLHSLYGSTRRPTAAMLAAINVLVCDLQDVGARFYTYASTLAYAMEECARHQIGVVVLDRPNPL